MQLENIPEFAGTQEDTTQPTEFLKMIKRSFLATATSTNEQKIGLFELYLKSDSPAEEWFNDAKTPKGTWYELEQDFRTRFPNVTKATKTAPELERELGTMKITTEELGKTEKFRGEDVYTHTIFAEKILDLAKRAKVKTSTSGLWKVRDEVPEILREKIPEGQAVLYTTIEQAASTTHSEMATIAVQTSERAKCGMQKKGNQHRNSGEKEKEKCIRRQIKV